MIYNNTKLNSLNFNLSGTESIDNYHLNRVILVVYKTFSVRNKNNFLG